jgi:translation elongation factor EF-1alpha
LTVKRLVLLAGALLSIPAVILIEHYWPGRNLHPGSIAVGERVRILPSGRTTQVRELRTREGSLRCAGLHAGVTLILADEIDVSRGDLIVRDDRSPESRRSLDATVCWLGDAPLDTRRKYLLRHTTRESVPASSHRSPLGRRDAAARARAFARDERYQRKSP